MILRNPLDEADLLVGGAGLSACDRASPIVLETTLLSPLSGLPKSEEAIPNVSFSVQFDKESRLAFLAHSRFYSLPLSISSTL